MEQYDLPYREQSGFNLPTIILFAFCFLFTAALAVLSVTLINSEDPIPGILISLFMVLLAFSFGYVLITYQVLKKLYIELTPEQIKVTLPFRTRVARWDEICAASRYKFNGNINIGILLTKDKQRKAKKSFNNSFNSLYGVPPNSFQIPLRFYKRIDSNRLLFTIEEQIKRAQTQLENRDSYYQSSSTNDENNLMLAGLASICLSCIVGVLYGLSIYKMQQNYVVIPLFASMLIIALFNRYYIESSFNLYVRVFLGIICFLQVPIAMVTDLMLNSGLTLTLGHIAHVVKDYWQYLMAYPDKQMVVLIIALICFGIGLVRGRVRTS